jgi:hypothetical protein
VRATGLRAFDHTNRRPDGPLGVRCRSGSSLRDWLVARTLVVPWSPGNASLDEARIADHLGVASRTIQNGCRRRAGRSDVGCRGARGRIGRKQRPTEEFGGPRLRQVLRVGRDSVGDASDSQRAAPSGCSPLSRGTSTVITSQPDWRSTGCTQRPRRRAGASPTRVHRKIRVSCGSPIRDRPRSPPPGSQASLRIVNARASGFHVVRVLRSTKLGLT